jgi:hypothetical protein
MEFVLPFLSCKQRANVAQTCKFLASKHRETPIESLLRHKQQPYECLQRSKRISGEFDEGRHVFPLCHTISIFATGNSHLHFVLPNVRVAYINADSFFTWHVPRIETIWYQGPRAILQKLLFGISELMSLDVCFTDDPIPMRLPKCLRFASNDLEGIEIDCSTLVASPHESRVRYFRGSSLTLISGTLQSEIPAVPNISIVSCSIHRLSLPRYLQSLCISQCNLIFSDLPVLPHVSHVDFSENHTLKDMPVCRAKLTSLNLLHTGVKNQIKIAMAVLADSVDFVGLNVNRGEEDALATLFEQVRIESAELCVAPHVQLPKLLLERSGIRYHTWSCFRKEFNHQFCRFYV